MSAMRSAVKVALAALAFTLMGATAGATTLFPPLITSGGWSILGTATDTGTMWADYQSYDNDHNNALDLYGGQGWAYLHEAGLPGTPVSFAWRGPLDNFTEGMGITAFRNGALGYDAVTGLFNYDARTADIPRLTNTGVNPRNYLLLARQIAVDTYLLLLTIEDLMYGTYDRIDSDVTDHWAQWTYTASLTPTVTPIPIPIPTPTPTRIPIPPPAPGCAVNCESENSDVPTPQVPEAPMLLLMGLALVFGGLKARAPHAGRVAVSTRRQERSAVSRSCDRW